MDAEIRGNILSSARHAIIEIEGIIDHVDDEAMILPALAAASSRLAYIHELLREADSAI